MTATPALTAALAKAQAAAKTMQHDKKNTYSDFNYTKSETVIRQARGLLSAQEITVIPLGYVLGEISYVGKGPDGGLITLVDPTVGRILKLSHSSGEEIEVTGTPWPIVSGKTPIDKAMHGALTTSLRCYLRDLLLLDAEGAGEADSRDDSNHEHDQRERAQGQRRQTPSADMNEEMDQAYSRKQQGMDNFSGTKAQREKNKQEMDDRLQKERAAEKQSAQKLYDLAVKLAGEIKELRPEWTCDVEASRRDGDLKALVEWAVKALQQAKDEDAAKVDAESEEAFSA